MEWTNKRMNNYLIDWLTFLLSKINRCFLRSSFSSSSSFKLCKFKHIYKCQTIATRKKQWIPTCHKGFPTVSNQHSIDQDWPNHRDRELTCDDSAIMVIRVLCWRNLLQSISLKIKVFLLFSSKSNIFGEKATCQLLNPIFENKSDIFNNYSLFKLSTINYQSIPHKSRPESKIERF